MTMLRLINFQSSTVSILSGGSWEGMKTEEKLFSALQRMSLKSYRTSQVTALTFQPRRELLTKTTQEDLMQSSSTAFRQQLSKEGTHSAPCLKTAAAPDHSGRRSHSGCCSILQGHMALMFNSHFKVTKLQVVMWTQKLGRQAG
jgi:hypothetical protein